MLKVVIDTNVWTSALLTQGTARKLVNSLKSTRFQLVYSNQILAELLEVTSRPKFAQKINSTDKADLTDLIQQRGILMELAQSQPTISRDPKDDRNIETVTNGSNRCLTTFFTPALVLLLPGYF